MSAWHSQAVAEALAEVHGQSPGRLYTVAEVKRLVYSRLVYSLIDSAQTRSTNLEDALAIVGRIERVRSVQRELKAAFARDELDGGAKTALTHPLYVQCAAELAELHDALKMLI